VKTRGVLKSIFKDDEAAVELLANCKQLKMVGANGKC